MENYLNIDGENYHVDDLIKDGVSLRHLSKDEAQKRFLSFCNKINKNPISDMEFEDVDSQQIQKEGSR